MRRALVTGGTSGIGRGIAEALAAAGHCVVATGIGADEVERFPATPNIEARRLDVTEAGALEALVDQFDRLDVLVTAAGIIQRGGREFAIEAFARTIEVNLTGTMRACLAGHGKLAASKGCIVTIASMLAFHGSAYAPGYSASKGAVVQLTKSLAAAWAPDGIRVNALAPGWIETPLTAPVMADPARSAALLSRTPMGRFGRPDDLGGAAVFLASEAARFITGAVLPVDGGYLTM